MSSPTELELETVSPRLWPSHSEARKRSLFHHQPVDVSPTIYVYHAVPEQAVDVLKSEFGTLVNRVDGKLDVEFPVWLKLLMFVPQHGYSA